MAKEIVPITVSAETIIKLQHAADQLELAAKQIERIFVKFNATSDERGSLKQARMRCIRGKERIREALTVKKVISTPEIDDTDETG